MWLNQSTSRFEKISDFIERTSRTGTLFIQSDGSWSTDTRLTGSTLCTRFPRVTPDFFDSIISSGDEELLEELHMKERMQCSYHNLIPHVGCGGRRCVVTFGCLIKCVVLCCMTSSLITHVWTVNISITYPVNVNAHGGSGTSRLRLLAVCKERMIRYGCYLTYVKTLTCWKRVATDGTKDQCQKQWRFDETHCGCLSWLILEFSHKK